jgi:phospholipase/carboxylesterase
MDLVHSTVLPRSPGRRPPLLLLLHGVGADEQDLLPLAGLFDPRFLVVAVRAPHEVEPMGYGWYAIDWAQTPPRGDPAQIVDSRERLARFVEEARAAHRTDPERTFLFGFSQGAIMSLALLLAHPELVAGVVAHSGRLARLPGAPPSPDALAHASALVLHGSADDVVPVDNARRAQEVLAPLLPGRFEARVFDGLAHGVSRESAAAAARWLTARLDAAR